VCLVCYDPIDRTYRFSGNRKDLRDGEDRKAVDLWCYMKGATAVRRRKIAPRRARKPETDWHLRCKRECLPYLGLEDQSPLEICSSKIMKQVTATGTLVTKVAQRCVIKSGQ